MLWDYIPSVIVTDQGRVFHNHFNAELMSVFGIKHKMTTLYHPQANGRNERYNQTVSCKFVSKICTREA